MTGSILKYFSRSALIRWYQRETISTSHKCLLNSHSCFSSTMKGKKTDTSADKRSGQDDDDLRACVYSDWAEGRFYVTAGRLKGRQEEGFFFLPSLNLKCIYESAVWTQPSNSCQMEKEKKNPQKRVRFLCECLNAGLPEVNEAQIRSQTKKIKSILSCENGLAAVKRSKQLRALCCFFFFLFLLFYKFNGSEPPWGGIGDSQLGSCDFSFS